MCYLCCRGFRGFQCSLSCLLRSTASHWRSGVFVFQRSMRQVLCITWELRAHGAPSTAPPMASPVGTAASRLCTNPAWFATGASVKATIISLARFATSVFTVGTAISSIYWAGTELLIWRKGRLEKLSVRIKTLMDVDSMHRTVDLKKGTFRKTFSTD